MYKLMTICACAALSGSTTLAQDQDIEGFIQEAFEAIERGDPDGCVHALDTAAGSLGDKSHDAIRARHAMAEWCIDEINRSGVTTILPPLVQEGELT